MHMRVIQYITNTHLLGLTPFNDKGETVMALLAVMFAINCEEKLKKLLGAMLFQKLM